MVRSGLRARARPISPATPSGRRPPRKKASAGRRKEGFVSGGAPMELLEVEPMLTSAEAPTHTSVPSPYDKRLMVFAGRGSQALGAKIAGKLGIQLGAVELKTFSNGEVYCRYLESIRGADVFIVQSTHAPVNRNLMELLLMIDAAKGASAHRIIAVMPG